MEKNLQLYRTSFLRWIVLIIAIMFLQSNAQDPQVRWLRITELQGPVNEIGSEFEGEFEGGNLNMLSWPSQYSIQQNTTRAKGLWIGAKNFYDPEIDSILAEKVVISGPRDAADRESQIYESEIKMIGKFNHPKVIVDKQSATINDIYDLPDELNENLNCDRMVVAKFNTDIGISVTKKSMAFDSRDHGNYFIHDYVFKNTGIYDRKGTVYEQTLEDVYFYFVYRYTLAGVTSISWGQGWGAFSSQWGSNTINRDFGPYYADYSNPSSPFYQLNGFMSYYGPNNERETTFDEDWGCPRLDDGMIGAAKYIGCVTLHADKSTSDNSNDINQPSTTWFIGSDIPDMAQDSTSYNLMHTRYRIMSEGHPDQPHSAYVGEDFPINYADSLRQPGGGTSQGQGFGPYTLAPGDSIHIVVAEGVNGLSWENCRIIGANWAEYYKGTGTPELILPDGGTASDHNQYKRAWVETGIDSLIKTFNNAKYNYDQNYNIPNSPPPPDQFTVTSEASDIKLTWSANAAAADNFDGFVIYRTDLLLDPETVYEKIFECGADYPLTEGKYVYTDTTAAYGTGYYYYIQTKSDGLDNDLEPGKPLYSSLFWTLTYIPAWVTDPSSLEEKNSLLKSFTLYQNYPNPFNASTKIVYDLGKPADVKISIYNIKGQLQDSYLIKNKSAGKHYFSLNVPDYASGIYYYQVEANSLRKTGKMILIK